MIEILHFMSHKIHMAWGAVEGYGPDDNPFLLQRILQGNEAGPFIWLVISVVIFIWWKKKPLEYGSRLQLQVGRHISRNSIYASNHSSVCQIKCCLLIGIPRWLRAPTSECHILILFFDMWNGSKGISRYHIFCQELNRFKMGIFYIEKQSRYVSILPLYFLWQALFWYC